MAGERTTRLPVSDKIGIREIKQSSTQAKRISSERRGDSGDLSSSPEGSKTMPAKGFVRQKELGKGKENIKGHTHTHSHTAQHSRRGKRQAFHPYYY